MKRIFILHLLPLEYYPPVTNLLNILDKDENVCAEVYSTFNNKDRIPFTTKRIEIKRTVYPGHVANKLLKVWTMFKLVLGPLFRLLFFRPDIILYYEPHSAMPAYLYQKFFKRSVRIFIHYHEYYSFSDFNSPSMASVRFFHKFEVSFLYKNAKWISQTNENRLDFFSQDYPFIPESKLYTLANYPPKSWSKKIDIKPIGEVVKILYLGALSFENTYIKEIVDFVVANPDKLSLDLYSYNLHDDIKVWLNSMKANNINFYDKGVQYEEIPNISKNYNVGLVLYNGHNTNYEFNAPNKLFEYLVCGLDVWVPIGLKGCKPYLNEDTRPFVISVDYENLTDEILNIYGDKNEGSKRSIQFNSEKELDKLIDKMKAIN